MSIETTTTTSSSGSTTTVGATVRDPTGPGGGRTVDVYLLIEPSKLSYDPSTPPTPTPTQHDQVRLAVYWKDQKITTKSKLDLKYTLVRKSGDDYEGAAEGTLIVCDRKYDVLVVKRFSLCSGFPRLKLPLDILAKKTAKSRSKGSKAH